MTKDYITILGAAKNNVQLGLLKLLHISKQKANFSGNLSAFSLTIVKMNFYNQSMRLIRLDRLRDSALPELGGDP